jgi:ADP-heptose:LPS heptosyltransferase
MVSSRQKLSLIDAIRRVRKSPIRAPNEGDPGPPVTLGGARVLLVYLFPALGDGVLIAPVVQALLRGGAAGVSVLVRKNVARILDQLDLAVEVIALPDPLAIPSAELDKLGADDRRTLLALEKRLAKRGFDAAVDLTFRADVDARRFVLATEAPALLGWIGNADDPARLGLTHGVADVRYQAERHWSRYQMLPLLPFGIERPEWPVKWARDAKIDKRAAAMFAKTGPRVLLVPGSRDETRRFPAEHFTALGRAVIEEHGGSVVVSGAPDEAKLLKSVAKPLGERAVVYSKKDLATLLALIHTADVVVTNDTGPMHFAFLAERPTIAIFTTMSPVCWGPPSTDPRFVVINAGGQSLDPTRAAMYARAAEIDLARLLSRGRP